METEGRQTRSLGSDHLLVEPERLVIRSPVDMLDWQVRGFRKLKIRHDGRDWELVAKTPGVGDTVRYDLVPWPAERTDLPGGIVEYDEAYVARRDAEAAEHGKGGGAGLAGLVLRPLIGLLPARLKLRLQRQGYGDAVEATAASRVLEWILVLLCGTGSTVFTFAGGMGGGGLEGLAPPLVALAALAGLDALARWSRAQEDPHDASGFWEWLFTRRTSAAIDSKNRADAGE